MTIIFPCKLVFRGSININYVVWWVLRIQKYVAMRDNFLKWNSSILLLKPRIRNLVRNFLKLGESYRTFCPPWYAIEKDHFIFWIFLINFSLYEYISESSLCTRPWIMWDIIAIISINSAVTINRQTLDTWIIDTYIKIR